MRHAKPGLLTCVLTTVLATGAMAQDERLWKTIDTWTISIDTTVQHGCYAVTGWDDGTVLRIGLNPAEGNFYLLLGNESWTDFAPDTAYDISIKFDSKPTWNVAATGLTLAEDDVTYLHAEGNTYAFLDEFMRQREMRLSHNGETLARLTLRGSSRAFREVITCQKDTDTKIPAPIRPVARAEGFGEGEDLASN